MLIALLIPGLIYAAIFRLTSNLLIVWPFAWSVASSLGTLMGGMQFTWRQVAIWSVILLVQLGFIGYTWRRQSRRIASSARISAIASWVPEDAESGVGLALQDDSGRYLFFLAGTRHRCPPGELFYAGIGGHREAGEGWLACAHREANEEIGTDVEILPAPVTWYIPQRSSVQKLEVADRPRPLAFYEMIHPPGTPRAGELYRIVIYKARLRDVPQDLPPDELLGVIALTAEQVIRGPERRPTLAELVEEGASVVAGGETVSRDVRLYPIGTAMALAHVLCHETGKF
jgi:ADP-ribose pyrophosphatase YjhB (NUDIX family)